jgi:hypothetical protein
MATLVARRPALTQCEKDEIRELKAKVEKLEKKRPTDVAYDVFRWTLLIINGIVGLASCCKFTLPTSSGRSLTQEEIQDVVYYATSFSD